MELTSLFFSDQGVFDMDKTDFWANEKFHDNQESTGIGLYLVYNHNTSLGGRIAVE
jgi:sensor histidine kinase regulating citrate/malate metabolism